MEDLFIPTILGTGHASSNSAKVANFVFNVAKEYFKTDLYTATDWGLTRTDNSVTTEKSKEYQKIIQRADGLLIVSPEYNHGYPGELKLMLDQLYTEYNRKPIGICGVSAGPMGGARMVEQLQLVAIELQMVPLRNAVYFSNVGKLFDKAGQIQDQSFIIERVKNLLGELVWYAKVLKYGRENIK